MPGPSESAARRFNKHSKDKRPDLPQVVLGMAVTAEGVPVRCWTFPGNTSDQVIIRTIKDDLAGWMLNRVVWVADRGFNSVANRAYLRQGGGHYVVAEKLRNASGEAKEALARPGRYHQAAGNLEVKEVIVGDGERRQRFVVCHNPEAEERDRQVRANLVAYVESQIDGTDEWTKSKRDELAGQVAHHAGPLAHGPSAQRRPLPHRQGGHRTRGEAGRQVAAADQRRQPHTHRPRRRLQAAARSRARVAGHEGLARATSGVPPPRGPDQEPRPALLARPPPHPGHRERHGSCQGQ